MFANCKTQTDQGNLGLVAAIGALTKAGYVVSVPLIQNIKYDLVIERDGVLDRVQVKTTQHKNRYGAYVVGLKTTGGNRKVNTVQARQACDYDKLFVLVETGVCYLIPSEKLGKYDVYLSAKMDEYKI